MFFAPETRIARFVAHAPDRSGGRSARSVSPAAPNVEQDEKSWTVSFDIPGVKRDELSIGIEGAVVRIESKAEAGRRVKAAFELPLDIDASTSEASLENGVLTLKLAKQVPINKVHQLSIN